MVTYYIELFGRNLTN